MMACHQVNPRGISALPVRNVAMLQLINSPAEGVSSAAAHRVVEVFTEVVIGEERPRAPLGVDGPYIIVLYTVRES